MGTSSDHKYAEAKEIMNEYGIELERLNIERVEIQADHPEVIAEYSLKALNIDVLHHDEAIFIIHLK
jgi:inosine/xanthosine triphosphate pyrophosphatase family protein